MLTGLSSVESVPYIHATNSINKAPFLKMDSSFTSSPRRAYDLPKPETGLAEWTSKIKALQREVDADEEAEQRRLEEEITAAREARLRRSRGMGGGSRADSLDLCKLTS